MDFQLFKCIAKISESMWLLEFPVELSPTIIVTHVGEGYSPFEFLATKPMHLTAEHADVSCKHVLDCK
jgi:hypothetical protein